MRKITAGFFILALLAVQGASVSAWAAEDAEDQLQKIAAKKAELNDHEWDIKLTSASGGGEAGTDTLIFKDQMFESKANSSNGYKPTNYTVSLQEGGPTIWETMQSTEEGKVIFWRGEFEGDFMKGVMSKQLGDGKNDDYYFSSVGSKVIEKAPEPAPEEAAPAVEAAVDAVVPEEAAAAVENVPAADDAAAAIEEALPPAPEETVQEEKKDKKKKKWGF